MNCGSIKIMVIYKDCFGALHGTLWVLRTLLILLLWL
jgi:hypothetical protein